MYSKKKEEIINNVLNKCHDGIGACLSRVLLSRENTKLKRIRFLHDTTVPPGATIGVHQHENDEEYYYIISGKGRMHLNDRKFDVKAGDITGVFPGESHGLDNTSKEDLRIIVISVE